MNYFVIQVLTRSEEKFIRLANSRLSGRSEGLERSPVGTIRGRRPGTETLVGDLGSVHPVREPAEGETPSGFVALPGGFSAEAAPGRLIWPRRRLTIRRKGMEQNSLAPIFPGYVFYEAEEVHPSVYWTLRELSGFIRILRTEGRLGALAGADRELLLHFLSYGEIVDKSLVYFDENRRIRVASGPMKGLEGQIVKVDKRKRRAKIRLSMYSDQFLVDFGFELLESAEGNERKAN